MDNFHWKIDGVLVLLAWYICFALLYCVGIVIEMAHEKKQPPDVLYKKMYS